MRYIDMRSDTVTQPTEEMRQAMLSASVGDDVYADDPTVNRLEAEAARLMGKDAALFVPTGTMGNQLAVMTHTRPGDEIILAANSHIYLNECGGVARLSGVSCALSEGGRVTGVDVNRLVRSRDLHHPRTSLVCLENALGDGGVVAPAVMQDAYRAAKGLGLAVHLDGARIFNAATALGVEARDIAAQCDSVMFCISKGLCSPVGSLLCGGADFVAAARRNRKLLGGGMRQAGVLAACGLVSLETMTKRLATDHENARYLGQQLSEIPGLLVNRDAIKINMVFWKTTAAGFDSAAFVAYMLQRGIKISGLWDGAYRFVTHNDISKADIDRAVRCVKEYVVTLG